ncbi:MAG TPA: YmdB family metallophosphoesterase [Candidatus Enteromonas pullicola]|uniref:YmdB family metallophosphoesterase n=1 Tax=Candidatus Alloenteromonas pullicola TaxID=2840784 RepID=A0A9D1LMW5_9FIRM|nr:YmdB family metallophosphoesterase [Candidatus Enteromonas pullicola]
MRILFLGDVTGPIGIAAIRKSLPLLRERLLPDFAVVNGENASNGRGITRADYLSLKHAGADVITLGNHYRDKKQIDSFIGEYPDLLRPANLACYDKGRGYGVFEANGKKLGVVSMMGPAFLNEELNSQYDCMEEILSSGAMPKSVFVDFHGESTSEKELFLHCFASRVSAIIGTHTHVQTHDATIYKGTAFMADAGMCGEHNSIIGVSVESAMNKIVRQLGNPFCCNKEGAMIVEGCLIDVDEENGRAQSIKYIRLIDGEEWKDEPLHY